MQKSTFTFPFNVSFLNSLVWKRTSEGFYKTNFNGIDLTITKDGKYFLVNDFVTQLCQLYRSNGTKQKSLNDVDKCKAVYDIKNFDSEILEEGEKVFKKKQCHFERHSRYIIFEYAFGDESRSFEFFHWSLIELVASVIDMNRFILWREGEEWKPIDIGNEFIYLVSPKKLPPNSPPVPKDKRIVKVGKSFDARRPLEDYNLSKDNKAEIIKLIKFKPVNIERKFKGEFNKLFDLFAGSEYFCVDNIESACEAFDSVVEANKDKIISISCNMYYNENDIDEDRSICLELEGKKPLEIPIEDVEI